QAHPDQIILVELVVRYAARRDEEALIQPQAHVARGPLIERPAVQALRRVEQLLPGPLVAHRAPSAASFARACSGHRDRRPSSLAGQTPRSVRMPVTSRAGVTSNP